MERQLDLPAHVAQRLAQEQAEASQPSPQRLVEVDEVTTKGVLDRRLQDRNSGWVLTQIHPNTDPNRGAKEMHMVYIMFRFEPE